jgi:N-acetyl sugar amidotransferase
MDKSAPEIVFDENGFCNFCKEAGAAFEHIQKDKNLLPDLLYQIKEDGEGKPYDVLIGLSGGVDSSTALHRAVQYGLRPLAFSVDNGWQSDIAQENIMRLVERLKVPYYRYTIDTKRFIELQTAFIKAGVPNIEIPSDHIILATSLELAGQYNIKWILSGGNVATESIMPTSWGHNARDLTHIKDIYRKMTGKKLVGLPVCGLWKWNYHRWVKGIKTLYILDYLDYHRERSKNMLAERYGWKDYGAKHDESVFTAWFQNFYLFEKFGFDKRKAHLSSLIVSGQMTRSEALKELGQQPEYPLLGFEKLAMKTPPHKHEEYAVDKWYGRIARVVKTWKS